MIIDSKIMLLSAMLQSCKSELDFIRTCEDNKNKDQLKHKTENQYSFFFFLTVMGPSKWVMVSKTSVNAYSLIAVMITSAYMCTVS